MALMRYCRANTVVERPVRFAGDDLLAAPAETLPRWRGDRMAMVYQDPGTRSTHRSGSGARSPR